MGATKVYKEDKKKEKEIITVNLKKALIQYIKETEEDMYQTEYIRRAITTFLKALKDLYGKLKYKERCSKTTSVNLSCELIEKIEKLGGRMPSRYGKTEKKGLITLGRSEFVRFAIVYKMIEDLKKTKAENQEEKEKVKLENEDTVLVPGNGGKNTVYNIVKKLE